MRAGARLIKLATRKYAAGATPAPQLTTSNASGGISAATPKTQSLAGSPGPLGLPGGGLAAAPQPITSSISPPAAAKPLIPPRPAASAPPAAPPAPPPNPSTPLVHPNNPPLSVAPQTPAPAAPPTEPQMTGHTQPAPIVSNTQGTMTDTEGKPLATSGPAPEVKPVAFAEIEGKLNDSKIPVAERKQFAEKFVTDYMQQNPELVQGFRDMQAGKNTPQAQAYQAKFKEAQDAYIQQQVQADPQKASTPQGFGEIVNNAISQFQNMPLPMQAMVGIGLPMGLIGIMSSLFGGGGMGMGIMGALGLGAGVLGGAAGGLFGQGAQNMAADAAYQMGSFLGMAPEASEGSLDALRGEDALQRLTAGPSSKEMRSAWWDPEAHAKTVQQKLEQAEQVKKLMAMPEGMRPQFLRNIDPSLSEADAVIAARNAAQIATQMDDPDSDVSKMMQQGRDFVANPHGVVRQKTWDAVNPMNWSLFGGGGDDNPQIAQAQPGTVKGSSDMNINNVIEKWAFNDMDAKELNDLKAEKAKGAPYRVEDARREHELNLRNQAEASPPKGTKKQIVVMCMKSARCWAGYEPVPGKKPYSNDSCRPIRGKKKKDTKSKK